MQRFDGLPSVVYVAGVDEQESYDLRIRTIAESGAASDFFLLNGVLVTGRSTPPRWSPTR